MTFKEIERITDEIAAKLGNTIRTVSRDEEERSNKIEIKFVKGSGGQQKFQRNQRDQQIIEDVILEIMEDRGVNREEAEKILSNPF